MKLKLEWVWSADMPVRNAESIAAQLPIYFNYVLLGR